MPAGQVVLVSGASGSGKSSLLRLLTGAYQNFEGNVLIDGLPIGNYQLDSLRSQTGVLLNQQDIFRGTLIDNITMGDTTIAAPEILRLAEKTGLADFIRSNKDGFDTMLDPLGKRLPQGIRQHILLTRALLGKSRLLLLEEPFLHLRAEQKQAVMEYLKKEKQSTVLIIAEKEEDLSAYDKVLQLQNGQVTS